MKIYLQIQFKCFPMLRRIKKWSGIGDLHTKYRESSLDVYVTSKGQTSDLLKKNTLETI